MNPNANNSRINQIIENQSSFGICLAEKATADTIAAATSLYFGLLKLGKDVSMVCAAQLPTDASITGSDKIQKQLGAGGDTLVISFPYTEGSIDKVSYHIEGENFNLLVQPRAGFDKLDPNQVKYTYSGGKVGVIITLDAPTLASLGELYTANEDQFKGKDIINIDRHLTNANFGSVNIVERQTSSTSEVVLGILKSLQIEIDREMATNLYAGIVAATNNFTSFSVNPNTFEACANLLKQGAVKKPLSKARPNFPQMPTAPRFNENTQPRPQRAAMPLQPVQRMPEPIVQSDTQDMTYEPQSDQPPAPKTIENKEIKNQNLQEESPDEWLKPKIFKGED